MLFKRLLILFRIMRLTGMLPLIIGFVFLLFASAFVLVFAEPNINSYFDSLWFLFSSFTTIGYGDIVVHTPIGRICTALVALIGILIVAFIPAVIIAYVSETDRNYTSNLDDDMDLFNKLERLDELSKEELAGLSKRFRSKRKHYIKIIRSRRTINKYQR